ncbi:DUF4214 domain-containing protein [uncultured Maritalea sp.]|uniref:DUF4214 domain-containing protein n=1 Tax=uncultured Maritalea sp. TaxID=757249 RepID=UPI00260320E9|nr:DUF4214 domain-containing protein [uncultured Maritalea sp.]
MANFVVVDAIPSNDFVAGLTTEPNNPKPVKWETGATLKYYFDDTGARAWSDAEKTQAAAAFAEWSNVANIDFALTTDRAQADFIQTLNESETVLGETTAPADGVNPPTIFYSVTGTNFDNITPGGNTFATMVHEIGHAIGLYHPHSGKPFPGVTVGQDQEKGTDNLNQQIWTVMSYVAGWDGQQNTGPSFGEAAGAMTFDIAAAQMLYGARDAQTGDNIYTLATANQVGTGWDAIWDTGGTDTITGAGSNDAMTIDLRAATLEGANAGGHVSWIGGIQGGFTIAQNVVIENAIGGNGADTIIGNSAANGLTGNGGNDTLDGGAGTDTAIYAGEAKKFSLTITKGAATTVQDRTGAEGTDSLTAVEKIDFQTGTKDVNLDAIDGVVNVSSADLSAFIEMYIAYFNRAPDAEGLFYWGTRLSEGMGKEQIAKSFYVQPETQALYTNPDDTEGFVTAVYNNFLGRAPDAEGFAYWVNQLNTEAVSKPIFLLAIINGAKAATGSQTDVDYFTNKANIGAYYSVIKGMSNVDNAKAAMALYDGTAGSITAAKNAIDAYHTAALDANNGELLIHLVGVMDDPFAVA